MKKKNILFHERPEFVKNILPHICFVAPNLYPIFGGTQNIQIIGGAEVQQSIIARELTRNGYKISIICLDYGQQDNIKIDGIRFVRAHKKEAGVPIFRFIYPKMSTFWRTMKRVDADIYYQRSAAPLTGLVALFCKIYKKKMIYAVASDSDLIPGKQLIKYKRDKLIFNWGLRKADSIVVQTLKQQEKLIENYQKHSVCIPNLYKTFRTEEKIFTTDVLWVGTIKPLKQPELFIELAQNFPEYSFKMIGGAEAGNLKDKYFQKIKKSAALIPNIEFTGFVEFDKIGQHFDSARLFVNTSETEGFPNTFLQAWSRCVPTLSFFNPDVQSSSSKQIGIVVKSIDHMAELIKDLLSDQKKLSKIGEQCRNYVETDHSVEKIIPEYVRLFSRLLN